MEIPDPDRWRVPFTRRTTFDDVDARFTQWMNRHGATLLRYALGVVFVWFGALKVVGISPAADLVAATVYVVPPSVFVPILGVWEVLIGCCLLVRRFVRVGIALLALQMPGTFLPMVLLPGVVFTEIPYGLTTEGQYIVKNLVIIGAALVIGGRVRADQRVAAGKRPHQSGSRTVGPDRR
jgi:uncharacterized membrane protein YkgB